MNDDLENQLRLQLIQCAQTIQSQQMQIQMLERDRIWYRDHVEELRRKHDERIRSMQYSKWEIKKSRREAWLKVIYLSKLVTKMDKDIRRVRNAMMIPGERPDWHVYQVSRLKGEWNTLFDAIAELCKNEYNG